VYVDEVLIADPRVAPHRGDELATAERHPRPGGQCGKQIELGSGDLDRLAVNGHLARDYVDMQTTEDAGWFFGLAQRVGPGAAQHRPYPGHQLARAGRLGEVVVGPYPEPDEFVHLIGPGGEHDHVTVGESTQLPAHLDAVEAGQAQVEHHHVG
jgi:hypothetical protein